MRPLLDCDKSAVLEMVDHDNICKQEIHFRWTATLAGGGLRLLDYLGWGYKITTHMWWTSLDKQGG